MGVTNSTSNIDEEPLLQFVRQNFTKIDPVYGKIPLYVGDSSFTQNKSSITICLTNPVTGEKYDANTVMYIALHLLGYYISKEYNVVREHNDNVRMLIAKATELGIYKPDISIEYSTDSEYAEQRTDHED